MTRHKQLTELSTPKVFHSLFQLANTLVPLAALWWLMAQTTHLSWVLTWVLALPAAGLIIRTFILQHDCGHGSLFSSRRTNDAVGRILGILTLTPYDYWRKTHALHHKNFGKLEHREEVGYFLTLTVREYQALSARQRFLYRVYRNPIVFCGIGGVFQFVIKHRFPWETPRAWRAEWWSVAFTNVAVGLGAWALAAHFGGWTVLRVQTPIVLITSWFGVWLFYLQHVFDPGHMSAASEWKLSRASLQGSSYYAFPGLLRWFSGDIGLHHVHHYAQQIPNYRLEEARLAAPELHAVPALPLRQAFSCWQLKLWDEEHERFVAFPVTETQAAGAAAAT